MRLYLSSYRLGDNPERYAALFGENRKVAVIASARDALPQDVRAEKIMREVESLKAIGLEGYDLDLRVFFGKKEALAQELKTVGGVWVLGGNTFVLRRAMADSGFDEIIRVLLARDEIVYGGYSAACCVLAPHLEGIDIVDDPQSVELELGKEIVWEGLSILPYMILPHYQSNHPESADIDKEVKRAQEKNWRYKTLRDGEAIVINGNVEG